MSRVSFLEKLLDGVDVECGGADRLAGLTLATDNPTVSATSLSGEYTLAIDHFELTQEEVDALIAVGLRSTFVPHKTAAGRAGTTSN